MRKHPVFAKRDSKATLNSLPLIGFSHTAFRSQRVRRRRRKEEERKRFLKPFSSPVLGPKGGGGGEGGAFGLERGVGFTERLEETSRLSYLVFSLTHFFPFCVKTMSFLATSEQRCKEAPHSTRLGETREGDEKNIKPLQINK